MDATHSHIALALFPDIVGAVMKYVKEEAKSHASE